MKNTKLTLLILPLITVLVGCAGLQTRSEAPKASAAMPDTAGALREATMASNDLNDSGSDLLAIPLEVNRSVLDWIDYFQGRGRPHMERYLQRSTRYMPIMKKILKDNGLPEDLIYIALIESGFSSTAHSHANAVGYWQFIRGTGKRYGLRIDSYVDERRDFVKATQAASEYFKGLYNLFGVWYLAIASYNVGENRVKGLVMKYHTRDFWQLARENKLPRETIDYVPKFLAARLIAKEPEKYGFVDLEYMPPLEFAEVQFTTSIDLKRLAQGMNVDYDDIRDLNPSYKRGVAFENGGKLVLRVPKGMETQALAAAPAAAAGNRAVYVAAADEDYTYYRVRRGDTVSGIAKKFGTSQRQIIKMNSLSGGARLSIGRRLRVPAERGGSLVKQQSSRAEPISPAKNELKKKKGDRGIARQPQNQLKSRKVHVVKKGDTLLQIARKYRVSLRELTEHNQMTRKSSLRTGTILEIP